MNAATPRTSVHLAAILLGLSAGAPAAGDVSDPIPESIRPAGIAVRLQPVARLPASAPRPPLARASMLGHDAGGRLFANDLRGVLYRIANGVVEEYLHLARRFPHFMDGPGLGTGFQSFAFHPEFAENGRLYTVHSEARGAGIRADFTHPEHGEVRLYSVLSEWTADRPASPRFSGQVREVLRIAQPSARHGLQQIGFNPLAGRGDPDHGMLYIGSGDGGVLEQTAPQRLDSVHGKMLRIDPLGDDAGGGGYGIPPDNPFAGRAGAAAEVWAYGLRNPHRFSWDAGGAGRMLITDIGEHHVEEVNLGAAGANYGWNRREGRWVFRPAEPHRLEELPPGDTGFVYPVAGYDHDEGRAIAGGLVYRGARIPELVGHYVFGDIVSGRLFLVAAADLVPGGWAQVRELELLHRDGRPATLAALTPTRRVDLRLGADAAGEIHVLAKSSGEIWRLIPARVPPRRGRPDAAVLLFREDWRETAPALPLTQADVHDPGLALGLYGLGPKCLKKSHHGAHYLWSGRCRGRWMFTLRRHAGPMDLEGQGRIRFRSRQTGGRRLRVVLKTGTGRWAVSGAVTRAGDRWQVSDLRLPDLGWWALDPATLQMMGPAGAPPLDRIEEIGLTDLQHGDGPSASSRVDWIEVWGRPARVD